MAGEAGHSLEQKPMGVCRGGGGWSSLFFPQSLASARIGQGMSCVGGSGAQVGRELPPEEGSQQ